MQMSIEITKMSSRGQVVIPQDIRNERNIKDGEKFLVFDIDDSIILKRVQNLDSAKSREEFEKVFASMWKSAKGITKQDVAGQIQAYRKNA